MSAIWHLQSQIIDICSEDSTQRFIGLSCVSDVIMQISKASVKKSSKGLSSPLLWEAMQVWAVEQNGGLEFKPKPTLPMFFYQIAIQFPVWPIIEVLFPINLDGTVSHFDQLRKLLNDDKHDCHFFYFHVVCSKLVTHSSSGCKIVMIDEE